MSMSIAYAMMNAGERSILSLENIRYRCLGITTDRFGPGYVYYRVFAALSSARSYRFDQISDTYSDRKMMKHLATVGQGERISNPPSEAFPPVPVASGPCSLSAIHGEEPPTDPLLIYVWRDEYNKIVAHNQHHGLDFVVFDTPTHEVWVEHGLTDEEMHKCMKEFYHQTDDE